MILRCLRNRYNLTASVAIGYRAHNMRSVTFMEDLGMEKVKGKKGPSVFLNIFSFITGSAFNIGCFIITIFLIYTFTLKAYDYGRKASSEELAAKPSREVILVVPDGADIWDVANLLKENDLIGNQTIFVMQAMLNGTSEVIKPGTYRLDASMKTGEVMDALQTIQDDQYAANDIKITIPEGLNLQQTADLLASKDLFTAEEFLEACQTGQYDYDFVAYVPEDRPNHLEGYLFPDTYFFTEHATPDEVIRKMLARFDDIYDFDMRQRTEELGLTIDQVIIMGSIIEGEIVRPEERELASAIIHNRLGMDMPLQMCSSIIYALDKRKDRLLLTDLEINSPYNTYKYPGLPIGPISNPGEASILAALYPADVDYLYFVLKDQETGEHVFTADYESFLQAKTLYNQQF